MAEQKHPAPQSPPPPRLTKSICIHCVSAVIYSASSFYCFCSRGLNSSQKQQLLLATLSSICQVNRHHTVCRGQYLPHFSSCFSSGWIHSLNSFILACGHVSGENKASPRVFTSYSRLSNVVKTSKRSKHFESCLRLSMCSGFSCFNIPPIPQKNKPLISGDRRCPTETCTDRFSCFITLHSFHPTSNQFLRPWKSFHWLVKAWRGLN